MSRGQLRLASERTPYLRAGLSWSAREPLVLDIRELTGERLLELIADPIVSIAFDDGSGQFEPLPFVVDESLTSAALQLAIDAIAEQLPPIGEPVSPTAEEEASARLTTIAVALLGAGFVSVEELLGSHAIAVAFATDVSNLATDQGFDPAAGVDVLGFLSGKLAAVAGQAERIASLETELRDANGEGDDAAKRIEGLEKQIVELKKAKPSTKKTTDPKPAPTDTPS